LLWYGFNGQVQGNAITNVLFGEANPSARLPFTWYKDLGNLPNINNFSLTGASEDGKSTGRTYMYYDGEITYPFGYGLSYTEFEYSNFTIDKTSFTPNDTITFTVDVTNTGTVDGKEVVQLYYSAPDASDSDRPNKKLCAFDKVEIAAGETVTVKLTVDAYDLWYYEDPTGNSLNQEETPMNSGELNTSADLVIDGHLAWLNGEYVFEVADAASNMTNDGPAKNSLTVTAVMEGEIALKLQNVTLYSGLAQDGRKQIINVGEQVETYAYASLNNDTLINLDDAAVSYSSNREDVATVDENGLVTAVAEGVVTITVTVEYNGETMTADCVFSVMNK
jgi:beta-glucosidase